MQLWWQNLSFREQIMVSVAGIFGGLFLVYQFLFLPIARWQGDASLRAQQAEIGYEQVIRAARLHGGQSQGSEQSSDVDTTTQLKNALASSAAQESLIVSSTEGNGDEVQITLAAAEPERIYNWMARVEAEYGAIVTEARITRARNNAELIKADRLVFVRRVER